MAILDFGQKYFGFFKNMFFLVQEHGELILLFTRTRKTSSSFFKKMIDLRNVRPLDLLPND